MPAEEPSITFTSYQRNKLILDLLAVRQACPKGIYISSASNRDPSLWHGVLFVRQGLYSPGIFRFNIAFPPRYPHRPPVITFTSDVFHPLVSPSSTYRHSTQDSDIGTVSASDASRLPPGAFTLKHGFPHWSDPSQSARQDTPHIVHVLYYLRAVFESSDLLDGVTLESAANPSAWHAYQAYNAATRPSSRANDADDTPLTAMAESLNPSAQQQQQQQQPGGARKPNQWNWNGVWEDRLAKSIKLSITDRILFQDDPSQDMIDFASIDFDVLEKLKADMAVA